MIDFKKLREAPAETVGDLCKINLADLQKTLQEHAGLYAYAAAAYETARVDVTRAKWRMEKKEAEVFNLIQEKDPSLAIGKTERRVADHPDVVRATEEYHDQKQKVGALKALVNGLEHRRDMLIQISARQRSEMESY